MIDVPETDRPHSNRRVVHVHCTVHGGTPGFVSLVIRKINGGIELDPHGLQTCIIRLDTEATGLLRDALTEWSR